MTNRPTPSFTISIAKEQLSKLPAAQFHGNIRVIDKTEDIPAAIDDLRNAGVIGFDTETRPSFRKGQSNSVALVQLSTVSVCYLFRINITGLSEQIISLLEDPDVTKIGLSTHDDFHNLNKITEIHPQGFIDLQTYVKQLGIADNSLTRIFGIVFGKRISKGQRLTNWEADHLTPSQQAYAALDAQACLELYNYISAGNFEPADSQYILPPAQEDIETADQEPVS